MINQKKERFLKRITRELNKLTQKIFLSLKKYPYELTADDALYILSDIYLNQTKEISLAKETLEKIIIDYPNSIYVIEARKLLSEL